MIQVRLKYIRTTKGLVRYEEIEEKGKHPLVGVLYLAKDQLGDEKKPPELLKVSVTIEE